MAASLLHVVKRSTLSSRNSVPPTFLLPWTATLTTSTQSTTPDLPPSSLLPPKTSQAAVLRLLSSTAIHQSYPTPSHTARESSPSLTTLLPALRAQTPHYIQAHIHGKPYLLTPGDTLRLPFRMPGVEPGDILRLDRATLYGSRDYTLKPPAPTPMLRSPASAFGRQTQEIEGGGGVEAGMAPHFIPHIAKGKVTYLDEGLFVCRAVVMGVESEPMRVMEKTKRRQRHVKRVTSKGAFTILRIREVRLRGEGEAEE
ncbi:hypothetical protein B0A48_08939 [Cryoendolithus antarcticus]|uniref:Large ribosomal subunit protein bL21m n=1 Tax=Cryoendolithus antarcticus TaxID=1507870 RepID=A0A1V8T4R7_9PEZI|nr:hypothetical protein B0A48_08939 [Cryoendolithus antarcticus]